MPSISAERIESAYQTALAMLLAERTPAGHWEGELSTSALSTATAVMALYLVQKHGGESHPDLIDAGLAWLERHQNDDGGWGDTTVSFSNISTTMLCRSAIYLTQSAPRLALAVSRAEAWLASHYGPPAKWPEAIRQRYGTDRTFATPILTTCALAGLVSWEEVPPLPFELSVLPQSWYRFVKLHVVSYALPALIAIGQCIYHHRRPGNPVARVVRRLARAQSLRVLESIQPSSGGFLEATPLTSFVTMSLAASGLAQHSVAKNGVRFLAKSVRPDGSWAIDSNLATWVTTLSINALASAGELDCLDRKDDVRHWLLNQQYKVRHPYTGADPGGWAWTDLPGGVPDADDTPGALLALTNMDGRSGPAWERVQNNIELARAEDSGIRWLVGLVNRDGGWPTFCRGWGHLPFDRSGPDLTAHAMRALVRWWHERYDGSEENARRMLANILTRPRPWFQLNYWWIDMRLSGEFADLNAWRDALHNGMRYLARAQRPDGSWLPLWFGNQHMPNDENPTYGTARVLAAYRDLAMMDSEPAKKGIAWLLQNQNLDGGWGGGRDSPSSIEETALVLDVLADVGVNANEALNNGTAWLVEQIEREGLKKSAPIGFYFAKLWYYERLYPIIFSVSALGRVRQKRPTLAN